MTSNALSIKEIMNILLTQEELTSTDAASNSQYGVDEDTLEALLDRSDIVKAWKEKGGKDKKETMSILTQTVMKVTANFISFKKAFK